MCCYSLTCGNSIIEAPLVSGFDPIISPFGKLINCNDHATRDRDYAWSQPLDMLMLPDQLGCNADYAIWRNRRGG